MEKALKIIYILIAIGIALYIFPFIAGFLGLNSGAVGREGIISISFDGGKTFASAAVHSGNVNIYDIEPSLTNASLLFAATNKGILLSRDGGKNWYSYEDLEGILGSGVDVHDILVNPYAPKEIYVATSRIGKSVVYVTRDNFFTLEPIYDTDRGVIQSLRAKDNSIYFKMTSGEIVRYSLSGKTFAFETGDANDLFGGKDTFASFLSAPSSPGLALAAGAPPEGRITALADRGPIVYLGSDAKLYRSNDYGMHWTIAEPIAKDRAISVIHISNNGTMVVVGSKSSWF